MHTSGMKISIVVLLAGVLVIGLAGCKGKSDTGTDSNAAAKAAGETTTTAAVAQTTCPIMGKPIDKAVFTEYKGQKVYFCCQGCADKFQSRS